MRWVPAAVVRPHHCAFIPFLGAHHPRGYFDFGTEIMAFDGHAYCSAVAVEQMAAALGWAPPGDAVNRDGQIAELEREIADLRAQLAEADRELVAVEVLKNSRAWAEGKRPGRPRKEVAA